MRMILAAAPFLMIGLGIAGAFVARRGHAKVALAILVAAFLVFSWAIRNFPQAPTGTDGDAMLWGITLLTFVAGIFCVWAGVKRTDAIF